MSCEHTIRTTSGITTGDSCPVCKIQYLRSERSALIRDRDALRAELERVKGVVKELLWAMEHPNTPDAMPLAKRIVLSRSVLFASGEEGEK